MRATTLCTTAKQYVVLPSRCCEAAEATRAGCLMAMLLSTVLMDCMNAHCRVVVSVLAETNAKSATCLFLVASSWLDKRSPGVTSSLTMQHFQHIYHNANNW